MTRRRYLAGDQILEVRLRLFFLVGRRTDPAAVDASERSARRDGG